MIGRALTLVAGLLFFAAGYALVIDAITADAPYELFIGTAGCIVVAALLIVRAINPKRVRA